MKHPCQILICRGCFFTGKLVMFVPVFANKALLNLLSKKLFSKINLIGYFVMYLFKL
jgi:hypothetical protein